MWRSAPLHLRVFIGSPGDVEEERAQAIRILTELPQISPWLKNRVTFGVQSWSRDRDPMEANADGQESVSKNLPNPRECDLTVIILWNRLGTPLPPEKLKRDGSRYGSGTEWEFEDARQAGKPIYLYVRKQGPDPPKAAEDRAQREALNAFLSRLTNRDGSIRGARNEYETVEQFRRIFSNHIDAYASKAVTRRKFLVTAAWVLAIAGAAAAGALGLVKVTRKPTVTVDSVSDGILYPAIGQARFDKVAYTISGAEGRIQASMEVAVDSNRLFADHGVILRKDIKESSGSVPLIVRTESLNGSSHWQGWVRIVLKGESGLNATSEPRRLEAWP